MNTTELVRDDREIDRDIADVVRTLMRVHGIENDYDLGGKVGIKRSTISNRLNGSTSWKASEIGRIAALFSVDVSVLYGSPDELRAKLVEAARSRCFWPEVEAEDLVA